VTISDYPDDNLIRTLSENVSRNSVSERCRVVPYAWGSEISGLTAVHHRCTSDIDDAGFDVIIAADTLWNFELHAPFIQTLCSTLKRSPESRIHLVAGLHTGRYTIQAFLDAVVRAGLVVESAVERGVNSGARREWNTKRADDKDEQERRRWVVWIVLKWE
jgi:EEF1A N-terminal glycine/lysine methyltransferase